MTTTPPAPGDARPVLPAAAQAVPARSIGLTAEDVDEAVTAFMTASPVTRRWDVEGGFDWAAADASRLTEGQRSAVQFVTFIEDHLPGYFALYGSRFPLDADVDVDTFLLNREVYHFTVRWAAEEDSHARALFRYQVESGIDDAASLRRALAEEGRKRFSLPHEHPAALFAYTLVQEKATQLYYQNLRAVVGDPVLHDLLGRLARDEARHFTFMADMVAAYLRRYGDGVVEPIRDALAQFRMPLAGTLRGYWRWALRIADVASYDHTEAYEHLVRVVRHAVDAPSDRVDELARFVRACRALPAAG